MNTYELCKRIRNLYVITAAEILNYDWNSAFCKKRIKSIEKNIKHQEEYFDINPAELTEKQMIELDFKKWKVDDKAYLIPLYLFPFLSNKIKTSCIDNSNYYLKENMDTDHRYGCIAYKIMPNDIKDI